MPEQMVEVTIDSIRVSLMSQQRIVILREGQAERYLPIWIGPYEAEAITIALQEVEVSRPLTHDLLNNVFRALEARILRVEVTALKDEVYFGGIIAEVNGKKLNFDCRPSDAIALAVISHLRILFAQIYQREHPRRLPQQGIKTLQQLGLVHRRPHVLLLDGRSECRAARSLAAVLAGTHHRGQCITAEPHNQQQRHEDGQ